MFHADRVGIEHVYERVAALHAEHGPRWTPAPLLERLAANGTFRSSTPIGCAAWRLLERRDEQCRRDAHEAGPNRPTESVVRPGAGGVVYMQSPPLSAPTRYGSPTGWSTGRAPHLIVRSWHSDSAMRVLRAAGDWRRVTYASAGGVRRIGRHCSTGDSRRIAQSSSSPATASSTGCWRWRRCTQECCMRRWRRPTRSRPGSSARCGASSTRGNPALVFAAEGARYERALRAVLSPGMELVTCSPPGDLPRTPIRGARADPGDAAVDDAHRRVMRTPSPKCSSPRARRATPRG
jgi:hypothetical protein